MASQEVRIRTYRRLVLFGVVGAIAVFLGLLKTRDEIEGAAGWLVAAVGAALLFYGAAFAVVEVRLGTLIELRYLLRRRLITWSMVKSISSSERRAEPTTKMAVHAIREPIILLFLIAEQVLQINLVNGKSLTLKVPKDKLPAINALAKSQKIASEDMEGWANLAAAKDLIPKDPESAKAVLKLLATKYNGAEVGMEASFLLRNIR